MDLLKRLYQYISPYRKRLIAGIISMLVHSFFTIFFIRVFQDLLETIISDLSMGDNGVRKLSWIALFMIIVYFLKGLSYYGQKYLIAYVAQKAVRDIREELYENLQNLSLSFYAQNNTGEIISRVTNDVSQLQGSIVDGSISIIYNFLTFLGGIGYLVYLNYRLTLFLIVVLPVMAYILNRFNKKIRKVSKNVQIKVADISDILQETLSAVRVVKSFGREEFEYKRFAEENNANFRAKVKNAQYNAVLSPVMEFLAAIAFTAILWFGGVEVMNGNMRASELIAFFTLLMTITSPLKSLSSLSGTIQRALASAERIFETMDLDDYIYDGEENKKILNRVEGHIKYENVYFSYNDDEMVLEDINFEANPGEVIALVGASGAGKTTLVDLIPRFYSPDRGRILLDGINIEQINLDSLRKYIGIVPQETLLFSGTLRTNILYGNLQASQKQVTEAAKAANAHEFIQNFKDGYNTIVGERGVGLSGGQRQRIAIARAILKDPKILILDEATSALDTKSEKLVQEALERLMKNKTTFVIAHRLSTIKNADKILVLSRGKIVEKGTHASLIENQKDYFKLYQNQVQAP
ncbi:MAG: ABC transporter ATP-binding protein [Halanaerobiales bacterium]